jgi:hypothetical protein
MARVAWDPMTTSPELGTEGTPRDPAATREPGERRPGGPASRLERPPGERYARSAPSAGPGPAVPAPWSTGRRIAASIAAAAAGGLALLLLGGIDLGPGLLAVTAATGWLTGLALAGGAPPGRGAGTGAGRATWAGLLAAAGVIAGLLADGVRALSEGGVLSPADYVGERFGPLAILLVASAVLVAVLRGR